MRLPFEVPQRALPGLKVLGVLFCLYFFIVGVSGMGEAFQLFGEDFAERVLVATANPIVGLCLGILATTVVQSSSTSTSIIVGMVAGGAISLEGAIPMIMGANIGTTITASLISLGHIHRPAEFERAFGASMLHLMFNTIAVAVIFPLERLTGALTRGSVLLAEIFQDAGGMRLANPLKAATEPAIEFLLFVLFGNPVALLVVTIALTFAMLIAIVKVLRSLMLHRLEAFFDQHLFRNWPRAMFFGFIFTVAVQSSSIPTTLVVPLAGAGILRLIQVYPYNLGSNVGTTVTAMLAALATASGAAITVAFSHLLFNLLGILLIWSIPAVRRIPLTIAQRVASYGARRRIVPLMIIGGVYFVIPFIFVLLIR